jgi:ATP-dependent Clp protease ATP-binding subunit ClpC
MFERYTEKARLVIFLSRKEAGNLGDREIKATHLLLGLLREGKALFFRLQLPEGKLEALREACVKESLGGAPIPLSVDLPLDQETKHILGHAAKEADKRYDKHIGIEHFLLASLQVPGKAKDILREHGITYKQVSAQLRGRDLGLGDSLDYT